jgi:hypothetical protein
MFNEIATSRTHAQGYRRRWFQCESMDLYTWHSDSGAIIGFQLAYDRRGNQRAITWIDGQGYFHAGIDEGTPGHIARTPLLKPEGGFDAFRVHTEFLRNAAGLDVEIALLVSQKLRAYLGRVREGPLFEWRQLTIVAFAGVVVGLVLRRWIRKRS